MQLFAVFYRMFDVNVMFVFLFSQDRSNAEVSCAGLFVGSHIGFDFPGVWIHIDIAYPVFSVSKVILLASLTFLDPGMTLYII